MSVTFKTSIDSAEIARLDARDPLRTKRTDFSIPDGVLYLDGNSLGALPKAAARALREAAEHEWGEGLIRSWNTAKWFDLPTTLGDKIGRLIGAALGETIATDSTSINIAKALHAGLSLRPDRHVIVAEGNGFPTDVYMAQGVANVRKDVRLRLEGVDADRIEDLLGPDVAVVLVNHVDYRTGVLRDMQGLTAKIHACGAIAVWDLCHTAGAMQVDLAAAHVDMAVGCTYKYLNGGPGAPAYISVATRHHGTFSQPLSGWFGHAEPFKFQRDYTPAPGIRAMSCGTPSVLGLRALAGALEVFDDVDLAQLRIKSLGLTDLFITLVEETCGAYGVALASPREHAVRGSQVSFRHPHAYEIMQALIDRGVIGDFRAPDFIRFGFTPLYLSYRDVYDAAAILHDILARQTWRDPKFAVRSTVT